MYTFWEKGKSEGWNCSVWQRKAFCALLCALFATATRELAALPRLKKKKMARTILSQFVIFSSKGLTHIFLMLHSEVWWQLRAAIMIRSVGWRSGELLMGCSGSALLALQPNSLPEMGWWEEARKINVASINFEALYTVTDSEMLKVDV